MVGDGSGRALEARRGSTTATAPVKWPKQHLRVLLFLGGGSMVNSGVLSVAIIAEDGKRVLATASSASSALLDLQEVAVTEHGETVLYDVVRRRIAIDPTGGVTAELHVSQRRQALAERLGHQMVTIFSVILTAALFGGLLLLWYLLAARLEETIGWGAAHADWVVFATVFGYFVWRAFVAEDPVIQNVCAFGAFGFGILALIFVQVQLMGAGDPDWRRPLAYQALGADVLAHREKWLSALALYTPTVLLILRFAGLTSLAETLERLGIGKDKK